VGNKHTGFFKEGHNKLLPLYINPVKIRKIILFTERQETKILALIDSSEDGIFKECT
jgi:hypothetical protein